MRERLARLSVGYHRGDLMAKTKNLKDRDNPQERREFKYNNMIEEI